MVLESSAPSVKVRLNTADRVGENGSYNLCVEPLFIFLVLRFLNPGNTPLHLAMDSGHAEAAVALINAGADRTRVSLPNFGMEHFCDNLPDEPGWRDSRERSGSGRKRATIGQTICG